MATQTLRKGHLAASGVNDKKPASPLPVSSTLETYYKKHEELKGIPAATIRKAWFTMAHLLLAPGSMVVDMGTNPIMTYAMAIMNPQLNYVGVNLDKKLIRDAQKTWQAPNLEFREGNISTHAGFEEGSVDAIVNSFVLHTIYSRHKYSERAVINTLENHFKLLKYDGLMFIRDYSMPPPEEYVLLEMPDRESKGPATKDMSEPNLLIWYAEHARPRKDGTGQGFFLEELPQRFPKTRLFRLPYKWAYEFIMRKDDRDQWDAELQEEYTFFTPREYRKNLRALGARVLYTAPQWDDSIIRDRFENSFRLYGDDGKPLPVPPTSFVALAQNRGEKKSLRLHEARPSSTAENKVRITAMRNDINGEIFDIISRDTDLMDIIPYRVTENGTLNIFVHDGLPRGIANAVPRTGKTLDGKRWSGHMTEAISVPGDAVREAEQGEHKAVVLFARDQLGLKPAMGCMLEKAPPCFPAPDFIDEQIQTRYLRVMEHEGRIAPKNLPQDISGFSAKGHIREVDAQSLLNAISVGYIPNVRLEMQILHLFETLGLEAETWNECPLALEECIPDNILDGKKFAEAMAKQDNRFKNVKGTAGKFRTIKSIFVDEGWIDGGLEGLAAQDVEFVIADGQTINKAIILPLTKHAKTGKTMLGLMTEYLPVPQRHGGNGLTLKAPSITLPKEIASIDQAKRFIGEQFGVGPEKVARLGESYFCHIGVTPIRVFPFCVATTGAAGTPMGGPVQYAPLRYIGRLIGQVLDWNYSRFIVERFRKVYHNMGAETSEVSGDWQRSIGALYDKIIAETPTPVAVSSPLAGFASMKKTVSVGGAGSVAQKRENAPGTYVTSPDFSDIMNVRDTAPPVPAQKKANTVTNDAKNKQSQKSKGE